MVLTQSAELALTFPGSTQESNVPLPPKVRFYDGEIDATLDQLVQKVAENEELREIALQLKFMVKIRSAALENWLTASGPG